MDDQFIYRLRSTPSPQFAQRLRVRLKEQERLAAQTGSQATLWQFAAAAGVLIVALFAFPAVRASARTFLNVVLGGQQGSVDGAHYANGIELIRPTDYREWTFLSSGLGMTYEQADTAPASPTFGNVFVNPSSYRSFMQTGVWPNGTIFVLEFRHSGGEASINRAGRFQTDLAGIEAEVKDARFPNGWAFFVFGSAKSAKPLSGGNVTTCVDCHTRNAAVERTFVQFYPTLLEIARTKGTLKPGF
jgi:cytochrome P460